MDLSDNTNEKTTNMEDRYPKENKWSKVFPLQVS